MFQDMRMRRYTKWIIFDGRLILAEHCHCVFRWAIISSYSGHFCLLPWKRGSGINMFDSKKHTLQFGHKIALTMQIKKMLSSFHIQNISYFWRSVCIWLLCSHAVIF